MSNIEQEKMNDESKDERKIKCNKEIACERLYYLNVK